LFRSQTSDKFPALNAGSLTFKINIVSLGSNNFYAVCTYPTFKSLFVHIAETSHVPQYSTYLLRIFIFVYLPNFTPIFIGQASRSVSTEYLGIIKIKRRYKKLAFNPVVPNRAEPVQVAPVQVAPIKVMYHSVYVPIYYHPIYHYHCPEPHYYHHACHACGWPGWD
jgi:hypothetical protein